MGVDFDSEGVQHLASSQNLATVSEPLPTSLMVVPDSLVGQVRDTWSSRSLPFVFFNSASRLLALTVRRGEALGVMDASTSSVPYFIASSFTWRLKLAMRRSCLLVRSRVTLFWLVGDTSSG